VLAQLEAAGWVDVGHALGGAGIPTAPTQGFTGTEFAMMRCDYILASKPLAATATSYKVLRTPATDTASDHYPVVATFEVPR
jgi:endonuclease/exonuclease/phosphatase family metal-dependent hydrolase